MKPLVRSLVGVCVIAIGATIFANALTVEPAPVTGGPGATKVVELICQPGWRGSGGGQYGGVGFTVACNNGRGRVRLSGFTGTVWSMRMGVESSSTALDCFFSGDSAVASESCGAVRLSIR